MCMRLCRCGCEKVRVRVGEWTRVGERVSECECESERCECESESVSERCECESVSESGRCESESGRV